MVVRKHLNPGVFRKYPPKWQSKAASHTHIWRPWKGPCKPEAADLAVAKALQDLAKKHAATPTAERALLLAKELGAEGKK